MVDNNIVFVNTKDGYRNHSHFRDGCTLYDCCIALPSGRLQKTAKPRANR
ncbi:MAG: hypothetical protein LBI64_01415 [Coriobacteriales bacterium]|nr:hypothetical protein [Coriobacteriales bacterium]